MSRFRRKKSKQPLVNTTDPETGRVGYTTFRRAQELVARGYAEPVGGVLYSGCLLRLTQPKPQPATALPPGPEPPGPATGVTTSKGDSLGGTRYSSNRETPCNPVNVWYLKDLLARDRWLFQLSVLDNLAREGA